MTTEEVIEIIKSHKRFSKYSYSDFGITIQIGENEYFVTIGDTGNLLFKCDLYYLRMSDIHVTISKWDSTKNILLKFGKLVKYIKKVDFFITQKNNQINCITPKLLDFLKTEHHLEPNFDDIDNILSVEFPQTARRVRGKLKCERFDVTKEKKTDDIKYEIYISITDEFFYRHFYFEYYGATRKLILTSRNESYNRPLDLTKIIRGEKLRNLMLNE